ncbi:hypothetical protein GPALN_005855 [Globodera pallida]|nr:hypothetical protein GPALN_005855 [Globodera pallida]
MKQQNGVVEVACFFSYRGRQATAPRVLFRVVSFRQRRASRNGRVGALHALVWPAWCWNGPNRAKTLRRSG